MTYSEQFPSNLPVIERVNPILPYFVNVLLFSCRVTLDQIS